MSSRALHVLHLLAEDPVIFHLFALELKAVWDRMQAEPQRRWAALIPRAFAGSWRHRALEALLPVFTDPQQLPADHRLLAFGPDQLDPLDATRWLVDPRIEVSEPWQSHYKVRPRGRLKAYPWAVQSGDFILHFVGDQAKQWMERSRHLVERYPS